MVMATLEERGVGLPNHFVIIGLFNDSLYCLDTSQINNGECPVVVLTEDYNIEEIAAESFGRFLYEYLSED